MDKKGIWGYASLTVIFALLVFTSMFVGNYSDMTAGDVIVVFINLIFDTDLYVSDTITAIVINIRIPRTLSAIIIGAALAGAGCCYQEVFRNDLASPDILGVSAGASVGAAIAIVAGVSVAMINIWSFCAGIITVGLVCLLSQLFKGNRIMSLLISGILISGFMNSVLGLIKYTANQETQLPSIVYWLMGDISSISIGQLGYITIPIMASLIVLFIFRWRLNYFRVSDSEAISTGININLTKAVVIVASTILVACSVAVAGVIAWIGLVIPHLIKTIYGENTRYTYPFSCIAGASFLVGIDVIGRLISTSEIPLSILTGIIGLVIFLVSFLIRRVKKNAVTV